MRRVLTLLVAGAMILAAGAAFAAEPAKAAAPAEKSKVILTWDEFVKITGYDPATGSGQRLTVPWTEVESLLGIKIEKVTKETAVDLPWSEFKSLLEWSIQHKGEAPGAKPPSDFIVGATTYTGTLSKDAAAVTLKATVQLLRKTGWKQIPILPGSVAITKTTLPDGVFLQAKGRQFALITDKDGAIDVEITFAVAVETSAGVNRVSFDRVAEGSSVLDLTIDRKDVDVKVNGAQSLVSKIDGETTRVAAALPTGLPVAISWERALPKVEAPPTKLYVETRTLVAVAEGMLLCQETVNANILHTGVRELTLKAPAETSVLTVTGSSVQDWRVTKEGELTVVFRTEVIGSQSVGITYERAAKDSVEIPVLRAVGAAREKGFIGVVAVSTAEITPGDVTGAAAIDVRRLPSDIAAMTTQPILLAFRYAGDAFTIPLAIKKHGEVRLLLTIVDRALYTAMQLNDGRRITKAVYSVRNNRNQFLRLTMPETPKADIWSVEVGGKAVSPAKDEKGNVLVPLIRSARSARELAAFPVEIVYIQTPEKTVDSSGTLRIELPQCDASQMHVMCNAYLPAEGKYSSTWGYSTFEGTLRKVKEFTQLAAGPGAEILRRDAARQVQQMKQQVDTRVDAQARAAGATPIRVRLPINGTLYKLERILALGSDSLWFSVRYRGWDVPE